jgi:PAS domain S-box-containing protein
LPRTELDVLSLVFERGGEALRAAAEAIPQMVWTSTPSGEVDFVNRRWTEYTGVGVSQIAAAYENAVHPEDRAPLNESWRHALKSGEAFSLEYRLRSTDGQYRWFLGRAQPLRDAGGTIRMWIGTLTDIDEQKRANESLSFVIEASGVLASASGVQAICDEFARIAVQRFADWCVIVLRDDAGIFKIVSLQHRNPEKLRYVRTFADRYPVADAKEFLSILERGEPILIPSISDEMLQRSARDEEHLQLLRSLRMHSAIVSPLIVSGETIGAVLMYAAESRGTFAESDAEVVSLLAERAALAISRAQAIGDEQRIRRRLQFVSRATETIHQSLDLTTTFGALTNLISGTFADFAVAVRIEREHAVRVIAASHRDAAKDDLVRTLVGVRPLQPDAEKNFVEYLRTNRTHVRDLLRPGMIERSVWPYLAREISEISPRSVVTIPLHARDMTYGAIIAYTTSDDKKFTPEEVDVLVEIGRHAAVAMENAVILERERRIAETLQDSLLPPSLPDLPGLRFDAVYLPGATEAEVGGDWYDAFVLENGAIVVSAGDVTGRGPDAAVVMGKVRHLLSIAPSYEWDPARILDVVESVLARRYPGVIVTAFLGIIDPSWQSIRFANAGHPPPVLRRAGGIQELKNDGLPVGLRREAEPSQSTIVDLHGAQMLVLYTDGLVESTHDVLAGYRRLHEVVAKDALLHTTSPAHFIEESCLAERPDDDVAVMTLQFDGSLRWSFDAENARAAQDARGQFVRYLRANAAPGGDISMAELVFGELVGNVVRHAPGSIEIDLDWSGECPMLHVIDRGPAFAGVSSLPDNVLSESGRGLFIVNALTRSLRIEHIPGYGNHVTAELPLRRKVE